MRAASGTKSVAVPRKARVDQRLQDLAPSQTSSATPLASPRRGGASEAFYVRDPRPLRSPPRSALRP
jgi:hypothetical protein